MCPKGLLGGVISFHLCFDLFDISMPSEAVFRS